MTERKFTGHVVSGRAVTTKDGLIAGINGSKSAYEQRLSTELTDEQIEAFKEAFKQTGSIIVKGEE